MEKKQEEVWAALEAKAQEAGVGSAFGLVNADPDVARTIVREVALEDVGDDDKTAGKYLSELLMGKSAEIVYMSENY